MSKKLIRLRRHKPSPAKAAMAFKCIIDHYSKNNAFDNKLLANILGIKLESADCDLISAKQTAQQLGCSEKTLANKRVAGEYDLPHVKIGSRVYYKQADIAAYIEQNVRVNTSDKGGVK